MLESTPIRLILVEKVWNFPGFVDFSTSKAKQLARRKNLDAILVFLNEMGEDTRSIDSF